MGWTFTPDDPPLLPGPMRPQLREALELDDRGYQCAECLKLIVGVPYTRIPGELLSYDRSSDLEVTIEYLCSSCWRIECLGAGIQW